MTHFSDPADYLERTDRIITAVGWSVPVIQLRSKRWLVHTWEGDTRSAAVPSGGLLRRFCGLKNAKPEVIATFARKYGLLYLCKHHKLPQFHVDGCLARVTNDGNHEPCDDIEDWRQWARRFEATLEVTRAILSKRQPNPEDIDAIFLGLGERWESTADLLRKPRWFDLVVMTEDASGIRRPLSSRRWEPQSPSVQLFKITGWLNSLLITARVTRQVVQVGRSHALAVADGFNGSAPLFAALTTELVAACAGVSTVARCKNCLRAFKPDRPNLRYCGKCRSPRNRYRLAQRARRARLKAEGLSARGRRLMPRESGSSAIP